jgi:hypothetical protein
MNKNTLLGASLAPLLLVPVLAMAATTEPATAATESHDT